MISFKEYIVIEESIVNLLPNDSGKKKYAKEVFDMVQVAYEPIGGLHGTGFKSPEDMIANIDMWKLQVRGGKVQAVALYKNSPDGGRKRVAVATDGTSQGKQSLGMIMKDDLKQERAFAEQSGPSLKFIRKKYPNFKKHLLKPAEIKKLLPADEEFKKADPNDPEVLANPDLKDFFYQRKIGGHWHHKVALGKGKQFIT